MTQLMPLPLTVSCFSKILIGFTFPVRAVCVQVLAKCVVWFLRYRKMCAWVQVSGSPELSPITVDCPTSSTQLQLPVRLQTITGDIQLTARLELNVSLHSLHYFTHTHTRLTAIFPGLPGWAGTSKVKPIWILLKQETVRGNDISWAICKSASRSRQITMPVPHHSSFLQAGCPSLTFSA